MVKHGLSFHHLGLAVRSPDKAVAFLNGLGYSAGPSVLDPVQGVNLVMCVHEKMPDVEVISPGKPKGRLEGILTRGGEMFYHVCYSTQNIENSVASMKQAGHRIIRIVGPEPAIIFGGRSVAFFNVAGFGIIELLEGPTP